MKVIPLRGQAREAWKAAGIADPVREADWLLAPALGLSLPKLLFEGDRAVAPLQAEQAWTLIRRRAAREPLQYLLATQEFCGLELAVTPDILVPRPETELLVEATLQAVMDIGRPRVLDVGTGSGCIAVSLARLRSDATEFLKEGGHLILELGDGQADPVVRLAQQTGAFLALECRKDAAGIERALVARKTA